MFTRKKKKKNKDSTELGRIDNSGPNNLTKQNHMKGNLTV